MELLTSILSYKIHSRFVSTYGRKVRVFRFGQNPYYDEVLYNRPCSKEDYSPNKFELKPPDNLTFCGFLRRTDL